MSNVSVESYSRCSKVSKNIKYLEIGVKTSKIQVHEVLDLKWMKLSWTYKLGIKLGNLESSKNLEVGSNNKS